MIPEILRTRRSVRSFVGEPPPPHDVDAMIEAACLAPAPHHSRPWRWVAVISPEAKGALARGMAERWRADLRSDGVDERRADELVVASIGRITRAPLAVLGCLTWDGLDNYPDERRRRAEHGMALLSLGAAVENLMLSATSLGYASCWIAAPIFCPEAARDSLALAPEWLPHALVLVGEPDPGYRHAPRPPIPLEELRRFA